MLSKSKSLNRMTWRLIKGKKSRPSRKTKETTAAYDARIATPRGTCCPRIWTSLIRLVSGRSKAAKISEVTKYREIAEKYQPNTRKVIKERIR
jgi:hypothetical protein